MPKVTFYFSHILWLFFLSKRLLLENSIYIYLLTPTRLLVGLCHLRILTNWSLWRKKRMRQQNFVPFIFSLNFRMDKLFCQALCRNRSIHYFVSALRNPVVWIVVLNSLSLPNINHEALINKLNIRTLERKLVYFPIRKNNTYQVVFIRAQRYFHSLSLNVLADKHVGFKRGKTPLSFNNFITVFSFDLRNMCFWRCHSRDGALKSIYSLKRRLLSENIPPLISLFWFGQGQDVLTKLFSSNSGWSFHINYGSLTERLLSFFCSSQFWLRELRFLKGILMGWTVRHKKAKKLDVRCKKIEKYQPLVEK